jgi:hypothetical protein
MRHTRRKSGSGAPARCWSGFAAAGDAGRATRAILGFRGGSGGHIVVGDRSRHQRIDAERKDMAQFKLETELLGLMCSFEKGQDLEFRYKSPFPTVVTFTPRYEQLDNRAAIGAVCTALTIQDISPEISFEINSNIEGSNVKPMSMSESIRNSVDKIYIQLRELSQSTVVIFSWTHGLDSQPDPCPSAKSRASYSQDGTQWFGYSEARRLVLLTGEATHAIYAQNARIEEVIARVEAGIEVPIGRQLFYEAWSQISINSRSALVIGVAAAEVALVRLINTLVPGKISSARTPPFKNMLREYLPKLPVKAKRIDGGAVMPPSEIIQQIEDAILLRNAVVHAGELPPERERLAEMLRAINDFLWMCDVYVGELWAVKHISFETQKNWGIR